MQENQIPPFAKPHRCEVEGCETGWNARYVVTQRIDGYPWSLLACRKCLGDHGVVEDVGAVIQRGGELRPVRSSKAA